MPTTRADLPPPVQLIYDALQAADPTAAAAVLTQFDLRARAQAAIANNVAYLAIGSPTNVQVAAQVAALTREVTALLRLELGQFDSAAGT